MYQSPLEALRESQYKEYQLRIQERATLLFAPQTERKDTTGYVSVCLFSNGFPSERFLVGLPNTTPYIVNVDEHTCTCKTKGRCKHLAGMEWWLSQHKTEFVPIRNSENKKVRWINEPTG